MQNVVIEAVPEIASFLTIQPNSFANVPANQPQSVRVSFVIPTGTTLGTYDGTLHVRIGDQTTPQTLKVVVNVWQTYSNSLLGFELKTPPALQLVSDPNNPSNLFFEKLGDAGYGLEIRKFSNEDQFDLEAWIINHWLQLPAASATSTIDQYSAIQEGDADIHRLTLPAGLAALTLLEHDEGDTFLLFVDVPVQSSVYVISASGKDIVQNLNFGQSIDEIKTIASTFSLL